MHGQMDRCTCGMMHFRHFGILFLQDMFTGQHLHEHTHNSEHVSYPAHNDTCWLLYVNFKNVIHLTGEHVSRRQTSLLLWACQ